MFLPGVWILWSKKKKLLLFFKKKMEILLHFLSFLLWKVFKKSKIAQIYNILWSPICRNKPAITPKWFNSLDTNSILAPYLNLFSYHRSFKNDKKYICNFCPRELLKVKNSCQIRIWGPSWNCTTETVLHSILQINYVGYISLSGIYQYKILLTK